MRHSFGAGGERRTSRDGASGGGGVAIIQNYYTPYRHPVFERMARDGLPLTVFYLQKPHHEQRRWRPVAPLFYRSVDCPSLALWKFVFFWLPRVPDTIVLLDNNPTNVCMVAWAAVLRLRRRRLLLWVQHIPDGFKPPLKTWYQKACSRLLAGLCERAIVFSQMSEAYLRALPTRIPSSRMIYAVPFEGGPAASRSRPVAAFGYLGGGSRRKNVDALVAAFVARERRGLTLHLAGMDPPPEAGHPGLRYWGYVDGERREQFFAAIDVLVLPSHADPWGLVVNEALHRGCLCAVSDGCGSSELVREIDPRLVFQPTQRGIDDCLEYLAHLTPDRRRALGVRAAALIGAFTIDNAARVLAAILRGGDTAGAPARPYTAEVIFRKWY